MAVVIEDIEISEGPPAPVPLPPEPRSAAAQDSDDPPRLLAQWIARQQWSVQRLHAD